MTHTVQHGETIYSIASKYGIDPAYLMRYNQLHSTMLHVGQKLRIPEGMGQHPGGGQYHPGGHYPGGTYYPGGPHHPGGGHHSDGQHESQEIRRLERRISRLEQRIDQLDRRVNHLEGGHH